MILREQRKKLVMNTVLLSQVWYLPKIWFKVDYLLIGQLPYKTRKGYISLWSVFTNVYLLKLVSKQVMVDK